MIFVDSFESLSSSWDCLVKNLRKNDFKYLSQQFDGEVLDLVKQRGFYLYEYVSDFESFKEKIQYKEKFCNALKNKKTQFQRIRTYS